MRIPSVLVALVASVLIAGSGESAVRRRAVRSPGPAPVVAPLTANDSYAIARDTILTTPAPGVLGNDTPNNAAIASYGINGTEQTVLDNATSTTQGGSIRLNADGGFTYNPAGGFAGSDTFRYILTNAAGSSTATVSITVIPPPPTAVNDTFAATQNTQLNVAAAGVLANDTLQGAAITAYGATGTEQTTIGAGTPTAQNGTIRLNADGSFRYDAPSSAFTGSDTFLYVVTNGGGSGTATVTINVQASGPDFTVTSPGFFYRFTGVAGDDPVLTLTRGRTYTFRINTTLVHPFEILDAPPGSVTNNNISNGTLIFRVPATADNYRYHCSIHEFGNSIVTVP